MSYLRYMCLLTYSGDQHILRYVFVLLFFLLCVAYVARFSGLSFLIAPSVFSNVYLLQTARTYFRILICSQVLLLLPISV
jgi:hypothetical protein